VENPRIAFKQSVNLRALYTATASVNDADFNVPCLLCGFQVRLYDSSGLSGSKEMQVDGFLDRDFDGIRERTLVVGRVDIL
jgi:hypothetical protein